MKRRKPLEKANQFNWIIAFNHKILVNCLQQYMHLSVFFSFFLYVDWFVFGCLVLRYRWMCQHLNHFQLINTYGGWHLTQLNAMKHLYPVYMATIIRNYWIFHTEYQIFFFFFFHILFECYHFKNCSYNLYERAKHKQKNKLHSHNFFHFVFNNVFFISSILRCFVAFFLSLCSSGFNWKQIFGCN